jgi:ferrous-iron efflux pump FieF
MGGSIAAYILFTSWEIAMKSLDVLMDKELSSDIREEILNIAFSHPLVLGVHDLRTRSSGLQEFIQMHLDLDEQLSFSRAHEVAQDVMDMILKRFPHAEIIIHQDPIEVAPE